MVNRITTLTRRARGWITQPGVELTRWQRMILYAIDLTRLCYRRLVEDRANQMAAALVYHTLFSLIPTLVLMLVVGRLFVSVEDLEHYKAGTIDYVLQWLNESSAAMATGVQAQSSGGSQEEFAQTADVLTRQIDLWLTELQTVNFGAIGAVGVVLFIYGATGLVTTIERCFNRIFGAPSHRPLYIRLPLYYTVITLGPLLLAVGRYLQNLVFGWIYGSLDTVTTQLGGDVDTGDGVGWAGGLLMRLIVLLSPLVSTWLALCAIYLFLPNTRVRLKPALIGSFVAATGVVLSIELFGMYVSGAVSTTLYGPLALMPLFLLWIYLLWLVVLFGLELTQVLQTLPGERGRQRRGADEPMILDPRWAIPAMAAAAAAFTRGAPITADQIAAALSIPPGAAERLARGLHDAGLLNRIGEGGPRYSLARPAGSIALTEVLDAGRALAPAADETAMPAGQLMSDLQAGIVRTFQGRTLADALTDPPPSD